MTHDQDISSVLGERTVFNGIHSEPMFVTEKVPLPELAAGEILVKVIQYLVLLHDVHTTSPSPTLCAMHYVHRVCVSCRSAQYLSR
jgi:hypothetical protein